MVVERVAIEHAALHIGGDGAAALRRAAPVVTNSLKAATRTAVTGRKLAGKWRSRVYPAKGPRPPAALITPRGRTANDILYGLATGVTSPVRPTEGRIERMRVTSLRGGNL